MRKGLKQNFALQGIGQYLFEVNVIAQLHVLCMNAKNLKATSRVRDADVNFAVEATESAKSRIDGIGAIGGCHDHNI